MKTLTVTFDLERGPSRPMIYLAGIDAGYEFISQTDNSMVWSGEDFELLKEKLLNV